MNSFFERLGLKVMLIFQGLGEFFIFLLSCYRWMFKPPLRVFNLLKQMEFIGIKSMAIVLLVGIFSGGVFSLQTGYAFSLFNAESMVGATVAIALAREIAPVFTAMMVVARAGSAMAAEIGSMKVSEQIDAMECLAVNPIHYLVVPRLIAGTFMVPLLSGLYLVVGIFGSYLVGVMYLQIPEGPFLQRLTYYLDATDIVQGLIKAGVFGFMLAALSSFNGLRTLGGAEGVGRATTRAVVYSCVSILIFDYFLTSWMLEYFPKF